MTRCLVGLSDRISQNLDKIKYWAKSFQNHCDDDIVLLIANAEPEDIIICERLGIKPVVVSVKDTYYINHKRLEHIANFMQSSSYDFFLVTDVFDVVFQNDPFVKMDLDAFDLFVSGEGVNVNQEPWNSDNISKLFPEEIGHCLQNEVVCSGVIAGKKDSMITLYLKMFNLCENSTNNHNIKDQAALIVMISKHQLINLKIFNLDDGWAMHCAVAGPTQFFRSWGFESNIKYKIPKMINGFVCNGDGKKYDIVHQFNRIPEWNTMIYNQIIL